ncbi:MAG: hypothetical protein WDO74_22345 [Pseudomonadota bacterium]
MSVLIALSSVQVLCAMTEPGAPIDRESVDYKLAVSACNDAADTCGHPRSKRALWAILQASVDFAVPKSVDWTPSTRLIATDLLVLELATGVSLSMIIDIFVPRETVS